MTSSAADALLDRFFAAIVAGDLDGVADAYADDVEVWHNFTGRALDRRRSLALLRGFIDATVDRGYDIVSREHWPGGAVQRHAVTGVARGVPFRIDVCIVFAIEGGRITRIVEYLDSAALGPLRPADAA